MTQTVALSNLSTPVSSFSIFSTLQSLTSKVNGVFGVYLTIALGFFLYHGYKCYQSLQLDDELKGVKCKVLLKEIENQLKLNAHADVAALVQEYETLHSSMSGKGQSVLQGLVDYYAKKNPDKAFQIADEFLFEKELFDACESIHKANPGSYLKTCSDLLNKAYESRWLAPEDPIAKVKRFLMYAKLAHSIDEKSELKGKVLEGAINTANKCGGGLAQANVCSEVDKVCKELGSDLRICETDKFKSFLSVAKDASEVTSSQKAAFEAHLTLAKAQFLCGEDNHEALGRARSLFDQGSCQDFELLASVYAESGLNDQAREVLNQAYAKINNDVEGYLRLASAYQKHGMQYEVDQALTGAKEAFTDLPEGTEQEIESKFDLMKRFSSWEIATEKQVKNVLGSRELFSRTVSDEIQQKISFQHIQFCNGRKGLEEKINDLMTFYLSISKKSKQSACDKIIDLVKDATTLSPAHGAKMLKAAEILLPEVPSCDYAKMIALIAEGYLSTNTSMSRELIDHYAKSQALNHGLSSVIPVIAIPIVRAYPKAGLVCLAAYAVRQMLL
jgi:hypothetical protein